MTSDDTAPLLELVCPAGTPAALRAAVDAGADSVYLGYNDETNARNFPGLNFSRDELRDGVAYAHDRGAMVFVAINTYPRAGAMAPWYKGAEDAVRLGADAVIVADIGLAAWFAQNYPDTRLHLSVQASASTPEAIDFYHREFGVRRVVLPRVLTVPEISELNARIPCETEVFVFGGLCVMAEGRCSLSSYVTGKSPNMNGVCSPASHVRYEQDGKDGPVVSKLGAFTVNSFAPGEPAGYPTLCKGRYCLGETKGYIFEEPTSLNALTLLPELKQAGVSALKIEGRQRSRAYIKTIVSTLRQAVDTLKEGGEPDLEKLAALAEGGTGTAGAYDKRWR